MVSARVLCIFLYPLLPFNRQLIDLQSDVHYLLGQGLMFLMFFFLNHDNNNNIQCTVL